MRTTSRYGVSADELHDLIVNDIADYLRYVCEGEMAYNFTAMAERHTLEQSLRTVLERFRCRAIAAQKRRDPVEPMP